MAHLAFGYDTWCLGECTLDSASRFLISLSLFVTTASDTKTFTVSLSNLVEGGIGPFFFSSKLWVWPFSHTHKRRSAHVCTVFCVLRSAVAFGQGLGYFYYVLIKLSFDSPLFTSLISCSLGFLALWQAATYLGVKEVNQANSVCDSRLPR